MLRFLKNIIKKIIRSIVLFKHCKLLFLVFLINFKFFFSLKILSLTTV